MKKLSVYLTAALLCAASAPSCGPCRHTPTVIVRDSVRVEYRDRLIRDTAFVEIPVEVEKIVTADTASHLENSVATSDAVVAGGFLHHSLATKPQQLAAPVLVHVTDTLVVEKEGKETVIEKEVLVEKKLTIWQRIQIWAAPWLLLLAIIGWRRELAALIKKLLV